MGIGGFLNLPFAEDQALRLLQDMSIASMTGDTEAMQHAIQEWEALSPTDKKRIEDIVAMMPYPGILPMQVQMIFSDPEQFIGAIGRLGSSDAAAFATAFAGATASSIVLAAVVSWLQTEQAIAREAIAHDAKKQAQKASQTESNVQNAPQTNPPQTTVNPNENSPTVASAKIDTSDENPINAALVAYISSPANTKPIDATESLQFLRNNPILLSSLTTVDQSLLLKAYQLAEAQIIIGILDRIIEMQARIKQEEINRDKRRDIAPPTHTQQVLSSIRDGIKTNEIPLSQSVVMAMQLLLVSAGALQIAGASSINAALPATGIDQVSMAGQAATIAPTEMAANFTAITSAEVGLQAAKKYFPNDTVATSVLVSLPTLYTDDRRQLQQPDTIVQLGILASVYAQMVPYWSIPAAVSFQAAAGKITEKSVTLAAVTAYALAITALISDPAFTTLLKNTITKSATDLTAQQITAYVAAIKCALLLNALVAVYMTLVLKKTTGQFNAKELADLILGKVALPPDSLESGLIKQIQGYLKDIPQEFHEAFIYQLLMNYGENTNVASLIDPAKQFLWLCDQSVFRQATAAESV
jgi:hypothetical protein